MASIVNAVSELESRRKALELELATVNSRLKAIQQALGAAASVEANGAGRSSRAPATVSTGSDVATRKSARKKVRKLRHYHQLPTYDASRATADSLTLEQAAGRWPDDAQRHRGVRVFGRRRPKAIGT